MSANNFIINLNNGGPEHVSITTFPGGISFWQDNQWHDVNFDFNKTEGQVTVSLDGVQLPTANTAGLPLVNFFGVNVSLPLFIGRGVGNGMILTGLVLQ